MGSVRIRLIFMHEGLRQALPAMPEGRPLSAILGLRGEPAFGPAVECAVPAERIEAPRPGAGRREVEPREAIHARP